MTIEEIKLLLRLKSTAAARSIFLQHRNKVLDKGYHLQVAALDQKWNNALILHQTVTKKSGADDGRKRRSYDSSKYEPFGLYVVSNFEGESIRFISDFLGISYSSFLGNLTRDVSRITPRVMGKVVIGIMKHTKKTAAQIKSEIAALPVVELK